MADLSRPCDACGREPMGGGGKRASSSIKYKGKIDFELDVTSNSMTTIAVPKHGNKRARLKFHCTEVY